jgi:multidrug resistance efflux pump
MSLTRLKAAAALFALTVGLLAAGTAVVSRAAPPDAAAPPAPQRPAPPAPSPDDRAPLLVRVPALRDGVLLGVGTEVAPGEQVPAERRFSATVAYLVVEAGPNEPVKPDQVFRRSDGGTWRRLRENELPEPGRVVLHRVKKEFRHLGVGDEVKAGQTVGLVDPVLALNDLQIKLAALSGAEADRRAARKTREEAERRMLAMEESNRKVPGSVSRDDYQGAVLTFHRDREEEAAKQSAVVKAQQELVRAQALVGMHEIRAPRAGVIRALDKEGGDVVKALETVLTLEIPGGKRPAPAGAGRERVRDVRGRRDGVLVLLGSEVKDGEPVAPEQTVMVWTGGAMKRYRRLREGDTVEAGQLLARLDDRLARMDVAVTEAQLRAGETEHQAARKTRAEAERRMLAMEESNRKVPGSVSRDDYQGAVLTFHRYSEEAVAREAAVAVRQAELEQAKALLTTYEIRSPARGVVRGLLKQPGEAVAAGEPVLRLGVPVP